MFNEDTSLFQENPQEDSELNSYSIIVENQIYYNRKDEYIFLVEQYLSEDEGKVGARLFISDFYDLFRKDNIIVDNFQAEIVQKTMLLRIWIKRSIKYTLANIPA